MEKCTECGKEFETSQALDQHKSMKHAVYVKPKRTLSKQHRNYIIAAVVIIAIAGIAYSLATAPGKYDDFAKCVSENGAKFYGAFWCPHCAEQKQLLGSSMKYINYIECSTADGRGQLPICTEAGITSYPTWVFADESRVPGVMQVSGLALKTNCTVG